MLHAVLFAALAAAPDAGRFRALFDQGETFYAQGEYGPAIWSFRQADALRATPEVAFDLAKCHERLEDYAFAAYYYRLYLRRAPTASDAVEVSERVASLLGEAAGRGRGLLEVEGTGARAITVGGQSFPAFPIAAFLPPGDHDLVAQYASGERRRNVSIRTGKSTAVVFEPFAPPLVSLEGRGKEWLEEWSFPLADSWTATAAAPSAALAAEPRPWLRAATYGVLGVSAAVLVAGSLMGALANADAGRINADRARLTVGQANALAGSANGKGGAANALWVVGGLGAAAGGVMLVMTLPEPGVSR
jgi:hypothetical protein